MRASKGRGKPSAWLAAGVTAALLAACGSSTSSTSTAASTPAAGGSGGFGTTVNIPVPASLRRMPLTNQYGKTVDLESWSGKTVLLVPFLTLCQDICPMTTGNLVAAEQSLRADHQASKVQIVELSVDPARDTPARLAAYAKLTGADWQLVTESPAALRVLQKHFGFYYQKVPEDDPDARDWWTGKPLTYDVDHTDNYFVIDAAGVERVLQDAAPDFHGSLNPKLYRFLDALGRQHLKNAPQPDWTPADVLRALAVSVGTPLAASAN
ncbi:MAG: SCO family protein [Solirubrobacterales bacterium]|nr:SCO family protein [Solirubrobacterales bacterium]